MSEYPKTLRAVRTEEGQGWAVAFALAAEITTTANGERAAAGELDRCVRYLAENGYERSGSHLSSLFGVGSWISARKSIQSHFTQFSIRMAQVAREAGLSPDEALAELRKAKRNKESLRVFSRRLTGKAWSPNATHDTGPTNAKTIEAFIEALPVEAEPQVKHALRKKKLQRHGVDTSTAGTKASQAAGHAAAAPARQAIAAMGAVLVVQQLDGATEELAELMEDGELSTSDLNKIRKAYDRFSEKLVVAEAEMELRT